MANEIDFRINVTGADESAREVDRLNRSMGQSQRTTQQTARVVEEGGRKWGEMAGAIGNVSSVVATTNPQIAQMGGVIGAVGSASSALTSAMGPLGVAIAGVTTALGLYEAIAVQQERRMAAQRREIQRLTRGFDDLASSIRAADEEMARSARVRAGTANSLELRAESERLSNEIGLINRALGGDQEAIRAVRRMGLTGETDRDPSAVDSGLQAIFGSRMAPAVTMGDMESRLLEQRLASRIGRQDELTEALNRNTEQVRASAETERLRAENLSRGIDSRATRPSGSGGPSRADRQFSSLIGDLAGGGVSEDEIRAELAQEEARAALDAWTEALDERIAKEQRTTELLRDEKEKRQQLIDQEREQARETFERTRDDAQNILGPAISEITGALSEVIAGTKSVGEAFQGLLSSFLEMIAQQAALEAAKEFAAAIGAFATYQYDRGALHLAAGAAWTGVAIAAGGAAIATAPSADAIPAAPQQTASGTGGGGGNTFTFNVNGPVITAGSRANAGREIASLVAEGDRRFGRG